MTEIVHWFECPRSVLNFHSSVSRDLLLFLTHKDLYEKFQVEGPRDVVINVHFKFSFLFVSYRAFPGTKRRYLFVIRPDDQVPITVQCDPSLVHEPIVSLVTVKKNFLSVDDYESS